jgi:hypothetical protein
MTKSAIVLAEFDSILLEAIDEGLSILGEEPKFALYRHLEKLSNLPKCEIPSRINEFSNAMKNLFGLGSDFLEILIMKSLHSKFAVVWEWEESKERPDFTLAEYCNFIKKYIQDYAADETNFGTLPQEDEVIDQC